jgi:hypothetical protein
MISSAASRIEELSSPPVKFRRRVPEKSLAAPRMRKIIHSFECLVLRAGFEARHEAAIFIREALHADGRALRFATRAAAPLTEMPPTMPHRC